MYSLVPGVLHTVETLVYNRSQRDCPEWQQQAVLQLEEYRHFKVLVEVFQRFPPLSCKHLICPIEVAVAKRIHPKDPLLTANPMNLIQMTASQSKFCHFDTKIDSSDGVAVILTVLRIPASTACLRSIYKLRTLMTFENAAKRPNVEYSPK